MSLSLVKCPAIDGSIEEVDDLAGEVVDKEVLVAAIVGSAQAVEHYEIAQVLPSPPSVFRTEDFPRFWAIGLCAGKSRFPES